MDRAFSSGSSASPPAAPASPSVGYPTSGNPGTGTPATKPGAYWYHMMTEEIRGVIAAAGLTPAQADVTQLLKAIQAFMQGQSMTYAVDTGAANAAVVSYSPAVTALTDGMVLWFKAKAANTGATTLNVNGLGASPVVGGAHSALQGGEIIANGKCQVVWNATLSSWVLIECTGGALQAAPGAQSNQAVNLGQFLASKSASGYQKLPSGLILQWMNGSSSSAGVANTLPIAFPNANLIAFGSLTNTISTYMTGCVPTSTTVVTAYSSGSSGSGTSIFAIGY